MFSRSFALAMALEAGGVVLQTCCLRGIGMTDEALAPLLDSLFATGALRKVCSAASTLSLSWGGAR